MVELDKNVLIHYSFYHGLKNLKGFGRVIRYNGNIPGSIIRIKINFVPGCFLEDLAKVYGCLPSSFAIIVGILTAEFMERRILFISLQAQPLHQRKMRPLLH